MAYILEFNLCVYITYDTYMTYFIIDIYDWFSSLNPSMSSVKADLVTEKNMLVIGPGFQNVMDSYFWYMPFCSQRQCKHVLDVVAKIPSDERQGKRAEIAAEHELDGARDAFAQGLKEWIANDMHIQRRQKNNSIVPASTKVVQVMGLGQ